MLLGHSLRSVDTITHLDGVEIEGRIYKGKAYLDKADSIARTAWLGNSDAVDFMWFLWGGYRSPLSGRRIRTFEQTYLTDEEIIIEDKNPYYSFYEEENKCNMILREFNLYAQNAHIINGHTPVRTTKGQLPIRAGGKLIVIDGGFCERYHEKTGIAGYTLIYNSHGMRLKAHHPFESVLSAITKNKDIESDSTTVEVEKTRLLVRDTDDGKLIMEDIADLTELLNRKYKS